MNCHLLKHLKPDTYYAVSPSVVEVASLAETLQEPLSKRLKVSAEHDLEVDDVQGEEQSRQCVCSVWQLRTSGEKR